MIERGKDSAHLRSDFYRHAYYKILNALTVSVGIMLVLIVLIIYNILYQPVSQYYATTTNGQIIQMIPR